MTRRVAWATVALWLMVGGAGCGGGSDGGGKAPPAAVPDPNGITVPKPAGKAG
jgi:hypothetical protein